MAQLNYNGGTKIKARDSELPIQNTMTAEDANAIPIAVNDNDERITTLENTPPGSSTALTTSTDVTNFDKNLSASDTDVQKALQTFNDADLGESSPSEIVSTVIDFKSTNNVLTNVIESFTIDKVNAINGARTICLLNSSVDPDFDNVEGLDGYSGEWVSSKDIVIVFNYLNDSVFATVSVMSVDIPFDFTPIDLGTKLKIFLDLSDNTSVTTDVNNNISNITDLSLNGQDFLSTVPSEQPFKKEISLWTDDVDDKIISSPIPSIVDNQQGEIHLLVAQKKPDNFYISFCLSDSSATDNFIYFGQNSTGLDNRFMIRRFYGFENFQRLVEAGTYKPYENLQFNIYSISSNGTEFKMYKNGVQLSLEVVDGTNDGAWFGDVQSPDTFAINGAELPTSVICGGENASIVYSDTVLNDDERNNVVRWMKRTYFGSDEPLNFSYQTLTPQDTYRNNRYNWDGSVCKNPINGNMFSIWSRGDSHYEQGDLHDISGQLSDDNGLTFANENVIIPVTENFSYSNPSLGYNVDGRLHSIYTKLDHTTNPYTQVGLFSIYSDDDGYNWSTPFAIAGLTEERFNSNSNIIIGTDGYLYTTYYEYTPTGNVKLNTLRSTDNGVSWVIYSEIDSGVFANHPINETTICLIADNTMLAMTRLQSRDYYNQYISIDNGLSWTLQGETNLCDHWTNETSGTSSYNVHLVRIDKFNIGGVECVGLIYLNRGVSYTYNEPTYIRVVFGRVDNLINHGVNGWADAAGVKFHVNGLDLDNLDGYPDIKFFDNNTKAYIRSFYDHSDVGERNKTDIQYFQYDFGEDFVNAILNI